MPGRGERLPSVRIFSLKGVSCFRFLAIVEAPLRKDRESCRPFPLAVAALSAPALLLPHPEGIRPPEPPFRGLKIYFPLRGDFAFPWKSSSWREFLRVPEKKAPLLCFFAFILITLFIVRFPPEIRYKNYKSPYYQAFTISFYSVFRPKTPFFLPPHLWKIRRVPEQGSRSRKERKSGEREISLLSPWPLLPQRWEVRSGLPAVWLLYSWRLPDCGLCFCLK